MTHVIYMSGLGDRYDFIRAYGLKMWRKPGLHVTHMQMRWLDPDETFDEKMKRLRDIIQMYPNENVTLVGESAGGAASIAAMRRFGDDVSRVITLCGMNYGASNVNPRLYQKNSAFQTSMLEADRVVPTLTGTEKARLLTVYSSNDFTVRPKNSLIPGVKSYDLKTAGHMVAILQFLYFRYKRFIA